MPSVFQTSNPALNAKTFQSRVPVTGEAMTLQGTVDKSGLLLLLAAATAAWTWWLARARPEAVAGIVLQALGLTGAVTAMMLLLYTSGMIRATPKFTAGLIAATGGISLFYMIDAVTGFFGHHVSLLYSNGPWGIAISVFIVIVAALNLIVDFDFVETGVHAGAAKYMEWYGAFGILVTLVWTYIEILHLLSTIRSQRARAT